MVSPNWGMLQPVDVGAKIQEGYQQGRQIGAQNAMSQYAANPDSPEAMNALAKFAPQYAIQVRQQRQQQEALAARQQAEAAKAQQTEDRQEMVIMGKLLDSATDEGSYQRARQMANQYGIDVSQAPPSYDPNWVESQKLLVRALSENKNEIPLIAQEVQASGLRPGTPEFASEVGRILKAKYSTSTTVSYQPGGGAVAYDRATGGITPLITPGGGQSGGGGIPQEAIADLRSNPASAAQFDEIFGQGAAAQALGGGGSNVTSGF